MDNKPLITIAFDGFSSSGKSTMAKSLAKRIGYAYIDTGAMYRAVTLYCIEHNLFDGQKLDTEELKRQMPDIRITFQVEKDGKSVTVFALGVVELPSEPFDKVCRFCNELNLDSCWLRYDADEKDNSIDAELEIAVGKKDAGEICLFVLQEIVGELDDTLGKFRK